MVLGDWRYSILAQRFTLLLSSFTATLKHSAHFFQLSYRSFFFLGLLSVLLVKLVSAFPRITVGSSLFS